MSKFNLTLDLSVLKPKKYYHNISLLFPDTDIFIIKELIEKVILSLKFMNISDVKDIYRKVNNIHHLGYEVIAHQKYNIVRASNRLFYKSTGTSRHDNSIKGIWFPLSSIEEDRLIKPEDGFIAAYNLFSGGVNYSDISSRDKQYMRDIINIRYGRFFDGFSTKNTFDFTFNNVEWIFELVVCFLHKCDMIVHSRTNLT
jgi:hypothetical protein